MGMDRNLGLLEVAPKQLILVIVYGKVGLSAHTSHVLTKNEYARESPTHMLSLQTGNLVLIATRCSS